MAPDTLTTRQLNRATLARQLLLERSAMAPLDAVRHLVGLQAQLPDNPYVALWSRLVAFDPDTVGALVLDRSLVRIVVLRGTIHLVTAHDCLEMRPLCQPVLEAEMARHREFAPHLVGLDLAPVLEVARPLLTETPMTGTELRAALADAFPDQHAAALAYACRNFIPLVQIPPRGVWGRSSAVRLTPAEAWLGRPVAVDPSIDDLVMRYLAAFGPATPADATTWSRRTAMREVFDRLRPRLRVFRDERGRELYDLPDAPRPDADTPAPVRFLPEYDNILLSHADRSRFVSEAVRSLLSGGDRTVRGTVMSDGEVVATWDVEREKKVGRVTLAVDLARPLARAARSSIESEGRRLLELLEPGVAERDVRFRSPGRSTR